MSALRYVPFETFVDASFWHKLASLKLNEYRLEEGPFELTAQFTNSHAPHVNPRISVDITSFVNSGISRTSANNYFRLQGEMMVLNTLERFKTTDKQQVINNHGSRIMEKALHNKQFMKNPDLLSKFQLLIYCDLKKHKFFFWFAYPAVLHTFQPVVSLSRRLNEEFSDTQIIDFLNSYDSWRQNNSSPFFILHQNPNNLSVHSFDDFSLSSTCYIGMCDSSVDPKYPCWLLRNVLYAICASLIKKKTCLKVVCFRDRFISDHRQCEHSLVLHLELEPIITDFNQFVGWEKWKGQLRPRVVDLSDSMDPHKLAESAVDLNLRLMKWRLMPDIKLSLFRDTKCLVIGAGTLGCNVSRQLLAWGVRNITLIDNSFVSPSNPVRQSLYLFSDSFGIKRSKAVAAAQALMSIFPGVHAEGVNLDIPMPGHPVNVVENSFMSVETASQVPPVSSEESKQESPQSVCNRLSDLIRNHDVVFLLTDTRESRWLPTLLAYVHCKLVINAALGFDTYLVMRHGFRGSSLSPSFLNDDKSIDVIDLSVPDTVAKSSDMLRKSSKMQSCRSIDGTMLGCYFCADVVGPMNSTKNRSLDQQCTVTRPGVSLIASALAVELMITLLQHPLGAAAPACTVNSQDFEVSSHIRSSLGLVPHQIRGFLSDYSQVLPATTAFSKCSACSQKVLDAYHTDGFKFLLRVFNDASYLEDICGLRELHDELSTDAIIMLSDNEEK